MGTVLKDRLSAFMSLVRLQFQDACHKRPVYGQLASCPSALFYAKR